jgi:hypothetical protein
MQFAADHARVNVHLQPRGTDEDDLVAVIRANTGADVAPQIGIVKQRWFETAAAGKKLCSCCGRGPQKQHH